MIDNHCPTPLIPPGIIVHAPAGFASKCVPRLLPGGVDVLPGTAIEPWYWYPTPLAQLLGHVWSCHHVQRVQDALDRLRVGDRAASVEVDVLTSCKSFTMGHLMYK